MKNDIIDVLVVGSGPAGLQAALHAVRKKAEVAVFGKLDASSIHQAHVENYLCVAGVTNGADMLAVGVAQIRKFGAEIIAEDILGIEARDGLFLVRTEGGEYMARALVLATGTSRKKLKVEGEKEFSGRGVSYCVDCDANFFRRAKVAVVGNGSAAVDGALTLLNYASDVFLIAKDLDIAPELAAKLKESAVQVKNGVWVEKIQGRNGVENIVLDDGSTLAVEGVFVELGAKGAIELAVNLGVALDMATMNHIETDRQMKTNVIGIYAAGDIAGPPYQMAKAVGDGCVAGWNAANYANKLKREA
ncbi:MAG: NAD(P)/FAD-dependent oxidoreductase [Deltaproteobacteria bacterium]|nr:NAD(P)/FAD-dependent oxidoreductase [Deltaproteobacteria bacterium]